MKVKITGNYEERLNIAIQRLLRAFRRDAELVNDEADFEIKMMIEEINKRMSVKVSTKDENLSDEEIVHDDSDRKYLILRALYRLLTIIFKKELAYGVLTGIRPSKLVYMYKGKLTDEEIKQLLMNKYAVSIEKANLLIEVVNNQTRKYGDITRFKDEVSIYINIPFCPSRCVYCSFTSYPLNYQKVSQEAYLEVLLEEIKSVGMFLRNHNIPITTIYVGGGTPTALTNENFERLLIGIEEYLLYNPVREYTIECGRPDTINEYKLRLIKEHQVSRISVNPQTFNDETLSKMNRTHTTSEIINTYQLARDIGLDNINMDLIIGLPEEKLDTYIYSLNKILALEPDNITVHYLAEKRSSDLYQQDIDFEKHDYHIFFNYAYHKLKNNGYIPYYLYRQKHITGNLENIGYCKVGKECLYNILMIEEAQTILGLGCNASTKFSDYHLILNPKDLISYMHSYKSYLEKKLQYFEEMRNRYDGSLFSEHEYE